MLKKIYYNILPILFCICFILSYVFEEQRLVVLTLSIISVIIALAIALIYVFSKEYKPFATLFIAIIMLFLGNGKYNFDIFVPVQNNAGFIELGIILICSIYKAFQKYKNNKKFVEDFIICTIILFILLVGCDIYINYGFDLSNEIETELVIEKQNDQGHSLSAEGYFGYIFIEYAVTSNDLGIETIDIIDGYKLKPGDKVKIVYRKGFHTPIYSTEYDPYWLFPG